MAHSSIFYRFNNNPRLSSVKIQAVSPHQPLKISKPFDRSPSNLHRRLNPFHSSPRPTTHRLASASPPPSSPSLPPSSPPEVTPLDWKLALILAGCSFEAYNSIEDQDPSKPHLTQTSITGCTVSYLDADFLLTHFTGILELNIKNATNLVNSDWLPWTKSDAYAVVSIGDSVANTKVVPNNLNPVWDETHYMYIVDAKTQKMVVRVLDDDVDHDDMLGSSQRGLADLVDNNDNNNVIGVDMELRGSKAANAGKIHMSMKLLKFDDVLADKAAAAKMNNPILGIPTTAAMTSSWRELQDLIIPAEAAAEAFFDPVAYIDNPQSDTQCWIFWNPDQKKVCVAFRGTESTQLRDLLTNLALVPKEMNPERLTDSVAIYKTGMQRVSGVVKEAGDGMQLAGQTLAKGLANTEQSTEWVHGGFLDAYDSVSSQLINLLEIMFNGDAGAWSLYVTGHSLGGALSTLAAYDYSKRGSWGSDGKGGKPSVCLINFGSPRVGNKAFAKSFDRLVPNAWRVVNTNDAVTLVPRMLGYCHIGHRVELTADGAEIQMHSSSMVGEAASAFDVALNTAMSMPQIAQKLWNAAASVDDDGSGSGGGQLKVAEGDGTDVRAITELLQSEIEAMKKLMDGSAVEEHLEPVYLENLKAALNKIQLKGKKKK